MGTSTSSINGYHRPDSFIKQSSTSVSSPHKRKGNAAPGLGELVSATSNGRDPSEGREPLLPPIEYYDYTQMTESTRQLVAQAARESLGGGSGNFNPLLPGPHWSGATPSTIERLPAQERRASNGSMRGSRNGYPLPALGSANASSDGAAPTRAPGTTLQSQNRSSDSQSTADAKVTAQLSSEEIRASSDDFRLVLPSILNVAGSSSLNRNNRSSFRKTGDRNPPLGGGEMDENWSMFANAQLGAHRHRGSQSAGSPGEHGPISFILDSPSSRDARPPRISSSLQRTESEEESGRSPSGGPLDGGGSPHSLKDHPRDPAVAFSETVVVEPKKARHASAGRHRTPSLSGRPASGRGRPASGRGRLGRRYNRLRPLSPSYDLARKVSNSSSFVTCSVTTEGMGPDEARVYDLLYNKMGFPPEAGGAAATPRAASAKAKTHRVKVRRTYQPADEVDPEELANFTYVSETPMPQPDPKGPITNVYHEGEVKVLLTSFLGFSFDECEVVTTPVGMDLDVHSEEEEEKTEKTGDEKTEEKSEEPKVEEKTEDTTDETKREKQGEEKKEAKKNVEEQKKVENVNGEAKEVKEKKENLTEKESKKGEEDKEAESSLLL
ncbi:hypothetical protein STCU_10044 [Strigomonas culicis]|uniref:Uncharacterized protein n=1 Tax=Strigomonas culicis TaxID=28005 RepID=S9V600_9TRYP|nr:hypothetical protein STCU_10044 [Strigomonas culicis]|eukprot:EPY18335.1 hypothetical protein STCU_10044 [Strigomonas culicis]